MNRSRMKLLRMRTQLLRRKRKKRTSPKLRKLAKPLGIGSWSTITNPFGRENLLISKKTSIVNSTKVSPKTPRNIWLIPILLRKEKSLSNHCYLFQRFSLLKGIFLSFFLNQKYLNKILNLGQNKRNQSFGQELLILKSSKNSWKLKWD